MKATLNNTRMQTLLIDIDGVIADFNSQYILYKKAYPMVEYPQSMPGFFLSLKPIEDAVKTIKELTLFFDVYFLTRPSYHNPSCYLEKRVWIEEYFGLEFCKKLMIVYDKSMVDGDYLIDDNIHEGFKGKHLHYGTDEEFLNWKDTKKYLVDSL